MSSPLLNSAHIKRMNEDQADDLAGRKVSRQIVSATNGQTGSRDDGDSTATSCTASVADRNDRGRISAGLGNARHGCCAKRNANGLQPAPRRACEHAAQRRARPGGFRTQPAAQPHRSAITDDAKRAPAGHYARAGAQRHQPARQPATAARARPQRQRSRGAGSPGRSRACTNRRANHNRASRARSAIGRPPGSCA